MARYVLPLLVLLAVAASSRGCSQYTIMAKLAQCQKRIQTPPNLVPIPGGGSKAFMEKLCKNQYYKSAISCIVNVFDSCPAKIKRLLNRFMNVKALNGAWSQLCARKHVYFRYTKCYSDLRFPLLKCIMDQQREIRSKMRRGMPESEMNRIICKAGRKGIACQDKVITNKCRLVAAKIIRDYNRQVLPAVCNSTGRRKRSTSLLTQDDIDVIIAASSEILQNAF